MTTHHAPSVLVSSPPLLFSNSSTFTISPYDLPAGSILIALLRRPIRAWCTSFTRSPKPINTPSFPRSKPRRETNPASDDVGPLSLEVMANFDWLKKVGATNEAVAVLNDQPNLFVNLLLVLVGLGVQCTLIWFIHFATLKPEQKKKKKKKKKEPATDNAKGGPGRK